MKKIIKNNLLGFVLGIILCSGIVYASSYLATDITYKPNDETWDVSNVNEALNSLYGINTELINLKNLGDATAEDIEKGKTAVVNGELITGIASITPNFTMTLKVTFGAENSSGTLVTVGTATPTITCTNGQISISGKTATSNGWIDYSSRARVTNVELASFTTN